jgi:myo-inositol-1(or 4)-monophosphatase
MTPKSGNRFSDKIMRKPEELRGPLEAVMREAGELARETARRPFKHWNKGHDHSPVSEGDIAVNELLQARLTALAPQAGWLSEESEALLTENAGDVTWVVDPIDGTRAYITGRADWTISVALVESGRPVLAALYAPATDDMFIGLRGHGAVLNGLPITASRGDSLVDAKLAGPKRYLDRLTGLDAGIQAQPRVFSLALRFARVAFGDLDAAFASSGSRDWDLAAADLLVHEAGGLFTDFAGWPLRYVAPHGAHGPLIAAGPARHGTLIDLVRDRRSEFA